MFGKPGLSKPGARFFWVESVNLVQSAGNMPAARVKPAVSHILDRLVAMSRFVKMQGENDSCINRMQLPFVKSESPSASFDLRF